MIGHSLSGVASSTIEDALTQRIWLLKANDGQGVASSTIEDALTLRDENPNRYGILSGVASSTIEDALTLWKQIYRLIISNGVLLPQL